MVRSQFHPLQVNAITGEPFFPLETHPNIILTPPRLSDIPKLPDLMNDPGVCVWLTGPPHPYTLGGERLGSLGTYLYYSKMYYRACRSLGKDNCRRGEWNTTRAQRCRRK